MKYVHLELSNLIGWLEQTMIQIYICPEHIFYFDSVKFLFISARLNNDTTKTSVRKNVSRCFTN